MENATFFCSKGSVLQGTDPTFTEWFRNLNPWAFSLEDFQRYMTSKAARIDGTRYPFRTEDGQVLTYGIAQTWVARGMDLKTGWEAGIRSREHYATPAYAQRDVLALLIQIAELESALDLIAASKRPDGTWNMDREACRMLAMDALRKSSRSERSTGDSVILERENAAVASLA